MQDEVAVSHTVHAHVHYRLIAHAHRDAAVAVGPALVALASAAVFALAAVVLFSLLVTPCTFRTVDK